MKSRWVRQAIHAELDSVREHYAAVDGSIPLDIEVDCGHGYTQALAAPARPHVCHMTLVYVRKLHTFTHVCIAI